MTGIIVFLATNIGQKASKIVDPDTGSSKPKTQSNVTSNNESNVVSNSNTTSNEESNKTSKSSEKPIIPASDLISYELEPSENNGVDGYFYIIINGTLYAKYSEKNNMSTNAYDEYTNNGEINSMKKIADGVKRIKTYNFSSGQDIFQEFIMEDGTVKTMKYKDVKSNGGLKNYIPDGLVDDEKFKNLKVDDIIEFRSIKVTVEPIPGYVPGFTVKLLDGTTKEVNLK